MDFRWRNVSLSEYEPQVAVFFDAIHKAFQIGNVAMSSICMPPAIHEADFLRQSDETSVG
jgi:hypothetical protein